MTLTFKFTFTPCLEDQLLNEAAYVSLFALPEDEQHNNRSLRGCFGGHHGGHRVLRSRVPILRDFDEATSSQRALVVFKVTQKYIIQESWIKKCIDCLWQLNHYGVQF
jgi:hypothetical protein